MQHLKFQFLIGAMKGKKGFKEIETGSSKFRFLIGAMKVAQFLGDYPMVYGCFNSL